MAAGFKPSSHAAAVLAAVRAGTLDFVWNEATRGETEAVLRRIPPLREAAGVDLFRGTPPFQGPADVSAFDYVGDPGDRKFAALAVASGSTLVTNDDDLLSVRDRIPIPVLTPRELMDTVAVD
ncbi:MAG: hypothetical protein CMM50_16920 [Rhodospirillaceae bacterium]|nr:hypothetical protein [Rhodospirillaceae bacterium]